MEAKTEILAIEFDNGSMCQSPECEIIPFGSASFKVRAPGKPYFDVYPIRVIRRIRIAEVEAGNGNG